MLKKRIVELKGIEYHVFYDLEFGFNWIHIDCGSYAKNVETNDNYDLLDIINAKTDYEAKKILSNIII